MTSDDTAVLAQVAFVVVTSIGALTFIGVMVHAYIQRTKRRLFGAAPAAVDDDRLARLEQAVDSIAIEVERISEGQRFLTKIQADRNESRALER
jgi:hypothetical protein